MALTTLQPFNLDSAKNFTFGNASATTFTGNVTGNLTGNVTGNLTGTVTGSASSATTAGTVTTAAQPNITSTGTLTSSTVTGNVVAGNVYANSGTIGASLLTGTLSTAAQPNITSTGTLSSLTVTANVAGGNLTTGGQVVATGNVTGNNISTTNAFVTKTILETATINASAFANPTTYDILTQSVWYSTASASTNFTLNIRGNSSVTANTLMSVGQSMSFALLVTNGATPYYPSAYQVDGTAITPKYLGGTAISSGNANSVDVYTYTLIKTAATPTYTLLATQSKFA